MRSPTVRTPLADVRVPVPAGWHALEVPGTGDERVDAVEASAHGIRLDAVHTLQPLPTNAAAGVLSVTLHTAAAPSAESIAAWCGALVRRHAAHRPDARARVLRWSSVDGRRASVWSLVAPDDGASMRALLVHGTVDLDRADATMVDASVALLCAIGDTARIAR